MILTNIFNVFQKKLVIYCQAISELCTMYKNNSSTLVSLHKHLIITGKTGANISNLNKKNTELSLTFKITSTPQD